jgi:glycosyltransferase involved in cell wall biosynthesis
MPEVSIIMPTYNRADTIGRAIESVRRQTFDDWELIIVDDGSTDGTTSLFSGVDPRIKLIRQENKGCYVARNEGLRQSRGRFIAFLDSDDEWLPHFLEITTAFLKSSPGDHFVMTEFLKYWGADTPVRHDIYQVLSKFVRMAHKTGSSMLDLPSGDTDDYLRVYETREPLGDWGREIARRVDHGNTAQLYRGNIFEYLRWGYLGWLPVVVLTRHALETIGPFLESYRSAADYRFLGQLFRHFRANMITVPSALKHDVGASGCRLAEGHLATGINEYRFALNRLALFDELFWNKRKSDPEINRIRGLYQSYTGRTALELGKRQAALEHLREACDLFPGLWHAYALRFFVRFLPTDSIAGSLYRFHLQLKYVLRRLTPGR